MLHAGTHKAHIGSWRHEGRTPQKVNTEDGGSNSRVDAPAAARRLDSLEDPKARQAPGRESHDGGEGLGTGASSAAPNRAGHDI